MIIDTDYNYRWIPYSTSSTMTITSNTCGRIYNTYTYPATNFWDLIDRDIDRQKEILELREREKRYEPEELDILYGDLLKDE